MTSATKEKRELGCQHHVYVTSSGQRRGSSFSRGLDERRERRTGDSDRPNAEVKGWV